MGDRVNTQECQSDMVQIPFDCCSVGVSCCDDEGWDRGEGNGWTLNTSPAPAMAPTWVTAARVEGTTLRNVSEQGINEVGKDD